MADDLDALTTSLRADPRDPVTIQALADWLEEKGAAPETRRILQKETATTDDLELPSTEWLQARYFANQSEASALMDLLDLRRHVDKADAALQKSRSPEVQKIIRGLLASGAGG